MNLLDIKKKTKKKAKKKKKKNMKYRVCSCGLMKIFAKTSKGQKMLVMSVCVEVLRPSQPNGVMSSAVSLPNHTFTGHA